MRPGVLLSVATCFLDCTHASNITTHCNQSPSSRSNSPPPTNTWLPANLTNSSLPLQLTLINNSTINATLSIYVTGYDDLGRLVMLNTAGSWVYPRALYQQVPSPVSSDLRIPMSRSTARQEFRLTTPLVSGRIWVAQGDFVLSIMLQADNSTTLVPPSVHDLLANATQAIWTFAELTYSPVDGLWVNLSYVDLVSLVLRLAVVARDGSRRHAYGLVTGGVKNICAALTNQSKSDGQSWDRLCIFDSTHQLQGILSPTTYLSMHPEAFAHYWDGYLDRVWYRYTNTSLTIDTQSSAGLISCAVRADVLHCADGSDFAKPSSSDVFGCSSGPFALLDTDSELRHAIVPRLCAAIHRATLLRSDGTVQPGPNSTFYYANNITNHYSRVVHHNQIENLGYAFPYDDVSATRELNQSNIIHSHDPQELVIFIDDP